MPRAPTNALTNPSSRMHPEVRRDLARFRAQIDCPLARERASIAPMPQLTRRRSLAAPDECWHVYYGDVRVGTIAMRTGAPHEEDPWGWACGFYPGSHPSECTDGTAATFDQARADFEKAWRAFYRSGLRPIFRHGAISGTGRTRSIAALTGTSACPRIGNRRNGTLVG
jgi:hypothetical protein